MEHANTGSLGQYSMHGSPHTQVIENTTQDHNVSAAGLMIGHGTLSAQVSIVMFFRATGYVLSVTCSSAPLS